MDRREALKRLGVGGALAVAAPALLDSFNVAHAASGIPTGSQAVPYPPATAKTNTVKIDFNEGAFGANVSFDWTVLYATPPITVRLDDPNDSSLATVTKAAGNGNMNSFTIEVRVWNESSTPVVEIARYLVISDGGAVSVVSQPF